MAVTTPSGTITFYKDVPFNPNYEHSIDFSTTSAQETYFVSKKLFSLTDQNYVKSENGKIKIQVSDHPDDTDYICYMSWKNDGAGSYGEHYTFYAFVTDITMISVNVVEISYTIDVLQTYVIQNGVSFGECYVERMTPSSDGVGEYLEEEPVSFTNYVEQNIAYMGWNKAYANFRPIVFSTYNLRTLIGINPNPKQYVIYGKTGGMIQGPIPNVFKDMKSLKEYFDLFSTGQAHEDQYNDLMNSIIAIIAVPSQFAEPENGFDEYDVDVLEKDITYHDTQTFSVHTSGKLGENVRLYHSGQQVGGYEPKYKKLYTYPFNFGVLSNNNGDELELRYEYFNSNTATASNITLEWYAAIQPDFEIVVYPQGYAGKGNDLDGSLRLMQVPIVPFVNDAYQQWLGTSRISTGLSTIISAGSGLLSGNPLGMLGGLGSATSLYDQSVNAKKAKDTYHSGGATAKVLAEGLTFKCAQRCVNEIDARRIDSYFDRFGYAVGRVMTPSHTVPSTWGQNQTQTHRYIKTSGCMVHGKCPAEYCRQIEKIFDNGITWWKSDKVGIYVV